MGSIAEKFSDFVWGFLYPIAVISLLCIYISLLYIYEYRKPIFYVLCGVILLILIF